MKRRKSSKAPRAKKNRLKKKTAAKKKTKLKSKRTVRPAKKQKKASRASSKQSPVPKNFIGRITHYFPQVNAAVVKIERGRIRIGDPLHFKGHTTDFQEMLQSMQLDHAPIQTASKGAEIGIGVSQRVREGDLVLKGKAV